MPKTHELKCWANFYPAVESGEKPFEVRYDDRGFRAGDCLKLREYWPRSDKYTGREVMREITYVLAGFDGLKPGYVVLGLKPTV